MRWLNYVTVNGEEVYFDATKVIAVVSVSDVQNARGQIAAVVRVHLADGLRFDVLGECSSVVNDVVIHCRGWT